MKIANLIGYIGDTLTAGRRVKVNPKLQASVKEEKCYHCLDKLFLETVRNAFVTNSIEALTILVIVNPWRFVG